MILDMDSQAPPILSSLARTRTSSLAPCTSEKSLDHDTQLRETAWVSWSQGWGKRGKRKDAGQRYQVTISFPWTESESHIMWIPHHTTHAHNAYPTKHDGNSNPLDNALQWMVYTTSSTYPGINRRHTDFTCTPTSKHHSLLHTIWGSATVYR